jgi:hypothetical protein
LLAGLERPEFKTEAWSKSHSRSAIAAAASTVRGLAVGIDIEWTGSPRKVGAIAEWLGLPAGAEITRNDFYRCWTFREAYFKAIQAWPCQELFEQMIAQRPVAGIVHLSDGMHLLGRYVADDFYLSLIWKDDGDKIDVPVFVPVGVSTPLKYPVIRDF